MFAFGMKIQRFKVRIWLFAAICFTSIILALLFMTLFFLPDTSRESSSENLAAHPLLPQTASSARSQGPKNSVLPPGTSHRSTPLVFPNQERRNFVLTVLISVVALLLVALSASLYYSVYRDPKQSMAHEDDLNVNGPVALYDLEEQPEEEEEEVVAEGRSGKRLVFFAVMSILGVLAFVFFNFRKRSPPDLVLPGERGFMVSLETPLGHDFNISVDASSTRTDILKAYCKTLWIKPESAVIVEGLVRGNLLFPLRCVYSIVVDSSSSSSSSKSLQMAFARPGLPSDTVPVYIDYQRKLGCFPVSIANNLPGQTVPNQNEVHFRAEYNKFVVDYWPKLQMIAGNSRWPEQEDGGRLLLAFVRNRLYERDQMPVVVSYNDGEPDEIEHWKIGSSSLLLNADQMLERMAESMRLMTKALDLYSASRTLASSS